MADFPRVSVIIRTKDRPALLREALRSVLEQDWPELEILVVNDGGEDVAGLLPGDPGQGRRLRYLDLGRDLGRSAAANAGLEAAAGEYLCFLDDDDTLDTEHVSHLAAALLAHPECVAAYSAVRTIAPDGTKESSRFAWPFDAGRLRLENYIPIHAVLFRRRLVDEGCRFDPAFDRLEDWDFWLQAVRLGGFFYTGRCTASYRLGAGSGFGARQDREAEQAWRLALYRKWLARWSDAELLDLLDRARQYPQVEHLGRENRELRDDLKTREDQVAELNNHLLETQERALRQLRDMEAHLRQQDNLLAQKQQQVDSLNHELDIIFNSRSWKLTRPLRLFNRALAIWRSEGSLALGRRIRRKIAGTQRELPELKSTHELESSWRPLDFPVHEAPLVSIVVPVYNQHLYTFHCLQALLDDDADVPFEVIVVDDRSSDETGAMLAAMRGITVQTNEENLGFIRSCNAGAAKARGHYLVLLNNDTEPRPGWLRAMLDTFRDFPDAGMVGARLVYPDGVLQEAGGIVWEDGSAWNYGRGDDPNKPEYSWCREADYCSGACLMLALEDFRAAGMFDERYLPAYYEDTDLAFKIREMGKKVYYQPLATVVHFEGVTSGTDTGSGIKQYQVRNREKFFERWGEVLKRHRPHGAFPHLEKERNVGKRVLVIDARVPMPDHDSGSVRMFSLLRIFQRAGYKVSFVPDNLHYHEKYTPMLQAMGVECLYHPYVNSIEEHLQFQGHLYDLVLLSRADYAELHMGAVERYCSRARILFDTVDLHFLREQREAELSGDPAQMEAALARKRQELRLARRADMTLVVSPAEIELFQLEAPDLPLALLSNIHRVDATEKPFAERRDILFIANFEHPPNIDAMEFFLDEVFPLVLRDKPAMRIRIVGGHPPRKLSHRAGPNVEIAGFVADIRPLFNDIRLSVAPLRYGAGVKGKINSSMAYGVPVVATTVAAEGMNLEHGRDVLVADSAEDFAAEVLRAYEDEALWHRLREAGMENIEKYFSVAVAERQLHDILRRLEQYSPAVENSKSAEKIPL